MNVGHGLPGVLADVDDHAVARFADALGRRDLVRLADHLGEQPAVGGGERRDVRIMILRDDKHMGRSLRVDIAEREYAVGFADHGRGELTGDDGAEQAVSHTKILEGRPPRPAMLRPAGSDRRARRLGPGLGLGDLRIPRFPVISLMLLSNRVAIRCYGADRSKCCRNLAANGYS